MSKNRNCIQDISVRMNLNTITVITNTIPITKVEIKRIPCDKIHCITSEALWSPS